MQRLHEFRLFYNHTIHPELLRMERKRKRLLWLLFLSILLLVGVLILDIYIHILAVTLVLSIFIGFYITYLLYRVQQFITTFKPNVVNLILDFIDDEINFGKLTYQSKEKIPKEVFQSSMLFVTEAPYYKGEDYIRGSYRELKFELCELNVREYSKVRNRLNYVFRGVFLKGYFNATDQKGKIIILPKKHDQYFSRTVKEFNKKGGRMVDDVLIRPFKYVFMTFASKNANAEKVLSLELQNALLRYRKKTKKEIYVSFINTQIFIAVTEPKDILEPKIFQSNVSFELVKEFFEDLQLLFSILDDLDVNVD